MDETSKAAQEEEDFFKECVRTLRDYAAGLGIPGAGRAVGNCGIAAAGKFACSALFHARRLEETDLDAPRLCCVLLSASLGSGAAMTLTRRRRAFFPTPEAEVEASAEELEKILQPLGLEVPQFMEGVFRTFVGLMARQTPGTDGFRRLLAGGMRASFQIGAGIAMGDAGPSRRKIRLERRRRREMEPEKKEIKDWYDLMERLPDRFKTPELCLEACRRDGQAVRFVPEGLLTEEMCIEAAKESFFSLKFMPERFKTPAVCREAALHGGMALREIPEAALTEEMCLEAFREGRTDCAWTLKYMPDRLMTPAVCLESVKLAGWTLQFVPEALKTADLCAEAVRQDPMALAAVPEPLKTRELCLEAVRTPGSRDRMASPLRFVPDELKTVDMCAEALRRNFWAEDYVPEEILEEAKDAAWGWKENEDASGPVPGRA